MELKHLKVLVVDDSEACRSDIKRALGDIEIKNVAEAKDGQEGLRKINLSVDSESPYDLVIMDLNMPKMDGIELLTHIKRQKDTKKIPVIVSSLNKEREMIVQAIASGAENYIIKPFDVLTVLLKVREVFKP